MTHNPRHIRRATTESYSSPSTSEDEFGPSAANLVPLLPRATSRRHRRYSCLPASLYGSPASQQETGLTADAEPVGVSNLTNQLQQQLLEQHMLQHAQQAQQADQLQHPQQVPTSHQSPAGQQQETEGRHRAEEVHVIGLALLHPTMEGEVGPSFTRLLGRSR